MIRRKRDHYAESSMTVNKAKPIKCCRNWLALTFQGKTTFALVSQMFQMLILDKVPQAGLRFVSLSFLVFMPGLGWILQLYYLIEKYQYSCLRLTLVNEKLLLHKI